MPHIVIVLVLVSSYMLIPVGLFLLSLPISILLFWRSLKIILTSVILVYCARRMMLLVFILRPRLKLSSLRVLLFGLFIWTVLLSFVRAGWVSTSVVVVLVCRLPLLMLMLRMARWSGIFALWRILCRRCWLIPVCLLLSGVGLCPLHNIFVIDFLRRSCLLVSLLLKLTIVRSLTSLIFGYGGASASFSFLLNFGLRAVLGDMKPFLLVMMTIELVGMSGI
jgi:hypothetical protein